MYTITEYTRQKAKKLGVHVVNSANPKKKLDVYYDGNLIAEIGDVRYSDYPTYLKTHGTEYAAKRRTAYYKRHHKDVEKGNGYLAAELLW